MDVLYKVSLGRDEYLGTAEEVVGMMARAAGAPGHGTPEEFMEGVARRAAAAGRGDVVDPSSEVAFLLSLREVGWAKVEERSEPSDERATREEALGDGPVAFGEGVDADDLRRDVLEE